MACVQNYDNILDTVTINLNLLHFTGCGRIYIQMGFVATEKGSLH